MDLVAEWGITRFMLTQWAMNTTRYFLAAGLGWLAIQWVFKRYLNLRRHSPKPQGFKEISREIAHSLKSGIIFLIPTLALVTVGKELAISKIYWDIHQHSYFWFASSFVILFFWHDTWFYWTHRLMHHPKLYKNFHSIHHQSVYPTPWAALSFNVAEAFVESFIFISAIMIFPMHWSIPPLFNMLSILLNIHGHLGHDIFSRETLNKVPFKWFNHPSTHGQHHLKHRGNYSLYLVFWDKVMNTWIGHIKVSSHLASGHETRDRNQNQTDTTLNVDINVRTSPDHHQAQDDHADTKNLRLGTDHAA
ncbi:MAG: sterol desaturase family protein [Bacteriovoracaceae bacterium]|nr:sterol desaturase family protein [Bacteriovoracaceae bacterium]